MSIAQDIETKCKTLIEAATTAAGYAPAVVTSVAAHDSQRKERAANEVFVQCSNMQPIKEFAPLGFCEITLAAMTNIDDDATGEICEAMFAAAIGAITASNLDGISTTHTVCGVDDSTEPEAMQIDADARSRMKTRTFRVAVVKA